MGFVLGGAGISFADILYREYGASAIFGGLDAYRAEQKSLGKMLVNPAYRTDIFIVLISAGLLDCLPCQYRIQKFSRSDGEID